MEHEFGALPLNEPIVTTNKHMEIANNWHKHVLTGRYIKIGIPVHTRPYQAIAVPSRYCLQQLQVFASRVRISLATHVSLFAVMWMHRTCDGLISCLRRPTKVYTFGLPWMPSMQLFCIIFYSLLILYCDMFRFHWTIIREYTYNFTKIVIPTTDPFFLIFINFPVGLRLEKDCANERSSNNW
jgi:hypothetical protein